MITIINKGKRKNDGVRVQDLNPVCWKWGEDRMGRVGTLFMGLLSSSTHRYLMAVEPYSLAGPLLQVQERKFSSVREGV